MHDKGDRGGKRGRGKNRKSKRKRGNFKGKHLTYGQVIWIFQ